MSNLLAALGTAANSFSTYQQALQIVANDTTNATTPGYAKQAVAFEANSFNLAAGQIGGVSGGIPISSRDVYAEHNVQLAQSQGSFSSTLGTQLQSVETFFVLPSPSNPDAGLSGKLNNLFSSFSSLSVMPNDNASRQAVLNAAGNVATAFNTADAGLSSVAASAASNAQQTVKSINDLSAQIQQINVQRLRAGQQSQDPGVDAQLYADLENLSQLVNISTSQNSDGTINVLAGGQQPLVVGTAAYSLNVNSTSGQLHVTDNNGKDATSVISGGRLGALLQTANTLVPSYRDQLGQLAKSVADTVNAQLAGGVDQTGASGAPLFTYDVTAPASSLAVTGIKPGQLAAASATYPGGNDNAVALSQLQTSTSASGLGGFTFAQFYGNLSAVVGRDSADAQNNATTQAQLLAQAQSLRSSISGVSLDEEASLMAEYQQAYNATSKLISVIAQMTQTALGLIPTQGS